MAISTVQSVQNHPRFNPESMNAEAIAQFIDEIFAQPDWFEVFHQDLGWEQHPIFQPIQNCRFRIINIIIDVLTERGMEIFFDGDGINEPHRWM